MTENPYASPEPVSDTPVLRKRPRVTFLRVLLGLAIIVVLVALLFPAKRGGAIGAARRTQCKNNLKQIAIALHNYESQYQTLPPAHTIDADGNALHSWRILILPQLNEQELYARIDLSKPWNDPANAEAYNSVPSVFRCPGATLPTNFTSYVGVVGSNACFDPVKPRAFSEMTDGAKETLMVIEVAQEQAVHWMAPLDASEEMILNVGKDGKLAHTGGFNAAFADGHVQFLSEHLDMEQFRALISIAGNDRVGEY